MSDSRIKKFTEERERRNETVMKYAGLNMKRFYSLDSQVYLDGAISSRFKEMIGLVASLVLRCDDCIMYHLIQCREANVTTEEIEEAITIGLAVGGSITIPHIRRAFTAWEELIESKTR
jgi:AhpD family alkylhydroperoxidase